jgi:hypothetical protein
MVVSNKKTSKVSNDTKNIYNTNRQYEDRNDANKLDFPKFHVEISKISSVILLLQSTDDDDVVERVIEAFFQ